MHMNSRNSNANNLLINKLHSENFSRNTIRQRNTETPIIYNALFKNNKLNKTMKTLNEDDEEIMTNIRLRR